MSGTAAAPGSDAPLEGAGIAVEPTESAFHRLTRSTVIVTFAALSAMIIGFAIKAPGQFDTWSNFRQLAQNVAILTVVSVGTTFVIATAGVDLSIPAGIVLGEVFAVKALGLIHVRGGSWTRPECRPTLNMRADHSDRVLRVTDHDNR